MAVCFSLLCHCNCGYLQQNFFAVDTLNSRNYPAYFWGLTGNEAYIKQELTQWNIIPGLCGVVGTVSFQPVDSSNSFLRHRGYLIYQDNFSDSDLFRKDACFFPRADRFFSGYTAYESVNYPNYFIRHQGYRLKISSFEHTDLFKNDASFKPIRVYP